jgi:Glycosyl hydrolase family 20, domain 2/Glycosyl hydrolase family 20, catalytic domain
MSRRTWLLGSTAGLGGAAVALRGKTEALSRDAERSDEIVVFPWPQSVELGSRRIALSQAGELRVSINVEESTGSAGRRAGQMIAAELERRTGHDVPIFTSARAGSFQIRVSSFDARVSGNETEAEGGYRLRVTPQAAVLEGKGIGLAYAAASFNQLLQGWKDPHLTEVEIRDWPEIRWRGIYAEVQCVAWMSLQDWKDFIDLATRLKLNAINVGLYNCWQWPSSNDLVAEFFLFPSQRYPQFKTPLRANYYSYKDGRRFELDELPPIYREDFFGQVVSYGKDRGVEISPYFTSLSHNTLIPRLMPEISMKDSQCRPIGYGFCTTCPKTYEVLFTLYDEIIDRYARPYGITTFHVGMDETRHVCQCPDCRVAWNGVNNFYVNHLIKIVKRLKAKGMTRVLVWHDMLHRLGLINKDLEARFKAEGIEDVITLCWWYYGAPQGGDSLYAHDSFGSAFFRPESNLKAWASPSAGWDYLRPLGASLHTENIALYDLLLEGRSRGASGTLSYSIHDPLFLQGYINFAQYSWNQKPSLSNTHQRFGRWLYEHDENQFNEALRLYESVYTAYSALIGTFYNWGARQLATFGRAAASIGVAASRESSFHSALQDLQNAAQMLQQIHDRSEDPRKAKLIAGYLAEVRRLHAFVGAAFAVLKCNTTYDQFRDKLDNASLLEFGQAVDQLGTSIKEHASVLRELEEVRYRASIVGIMVYETRAHEDMEKFDRIFSELLRRARRGDTQYLPEVEVAANDFVGTNLGMILPAEM